MRDTDIRVREVDIFFTDERGRAPLKFGNMVMDAITYCEARVLVETARGGKAEGWGGMFLSDFWAFPDSRVPHAEREKAMREIVRRYALLVTQREGYAHPVDIYWNLEDDLRRLCQEVSREMGFAAEMPFLGGLVSASPVDAAMHDAFGNVHGLSTYECYGPEFMEHDLRRYLGPDFADLYIADYIRKSYSPRLPVFHLVGGLDKLRSSEVTDDDPKDGLPNSLDDWIARNGATCLKIKLKGTDLEWDVQRTVDAANIAHEMHQRKREGATLSLSADTNELCESPDYMIEYLHRVKELSPRTYDELLYIEQPTERDLKAHRFDMRKLGAMKPVMVDESLTGVQDFDLAMELGWSGIALKACKCQSAELVISSKAAQMGVPYTVQDLTNPGLALIHSVGLAARLDPLKGVESNGMQYFPASSEPEAKVHTGIFHPTDGMVSTQSMTGPGLGYRINEIRRSRPEPIRIGG